MSDDETLLSATEATELLGVKPATLYTYVSRGLLRAIPVPGSRKKRYPRADLERLKARQLARSGHGPVAASALRWGEPVIESAITVIDSERGPLYRGIPATELATSGRTFESVAEHLWTGEPVPDDRAWAPAHYGDATLPLERADLERLCPPRTPPVARLTLAVPALALADPGRFGAPPEAELRRARKLLRWLVDLLRPSAPQPPGAYLRDHLAVAFRLPVSAARDLERALILCADHELNASAFAARVAAAAGADLYASIGAALATFSGARHGGACDRVDALLDEAELKGDPVALVHDRLRRGEQIPGFGQPLYPQGDPRTPPLLAAALRVDAARARPALTLVAAMEAMGHPAPALDYGLVTLTRALGLPSGSASALFAVGRAAGWVAHILEQRTQPGLLRPRARERSA